MEKWGGKSWGGAGTIVRIWGGKKGSIGRVPTGDWAEMTESSGKHGGKGIGARDHAWRTYLWPASGLPGLAAIVFFCVFLSASAFTIFVLFVFAFAFAFAAMTYFCPIRCKSVIQSCLQTPMFQGTLAHKQADKGHALEERKQPRTPRARSIHFFPLLMIGGQRSSNGSHEGVPFQGSRTPSTNCEERRLLYGNGVASVC